MSSPISTPVPHLYEALEVSPRASAPVIKAAYRCLVQQHHPDHNPGDAAAAERLVNINQAYAVLSDPQRRAQYDRKLGLSAVSEDRRMSCVAPIKTAKVTNGHPVSRRFAFRPLTD